MEEETLTFNFTLAEANIILGALGELPAKVSMGLIAKIQSEATTQRIELSEDEEGAE
jgi:hypothetical protein